jgi:hypothetical protein
MVKHLLGMSIYQTIIVFGITFAAYSIIPEEVPGGEESIIC